MKKRSISKWKKEADRVFSLWIRAREKACVTCGNKNNLQAGHFESRSFNQLRYSEINVHTQCVGCNMFKSGNMAEYARFMIKKYGVEILDELAREKRKIKQWKTGELEEIIERYKI